MIKKAAVAAGGVDTISNSGAEHELLERVRAGDDTAFEDLVRRHSGRMLTVARRILKRDQDAQDAVQDAWICAFRGLHSFREGCQLSTWLHRIVVNAALMKLRKQRRALERPIEPLLPTFRADGHHAHVVARWIDAEQLLTRAETRAVVRRAIDQLPEGYRTVLVLRDIEELPMEEVAAALGISTNAVKIRAHRARQALITLLAPEFTAPARRPALKASWLTAAAGAAY